MDDINNDSAISVNNLHDPNFPVQPNIDEEREDVSNVKEERAITREEQARTYHVDSNSITGVQVSREGAGGNVQQNMISPTSQQSLSQPGNETQTSLTPEVQRLTGTRERNTFEPIEVPLQEAFEMHI